jgi:ABC-2 type transport system ATP-binding protein
MVATEKGGGDGVVDIACAGVTKVFKDFWMRPRVRAVEAVDLEVRRGQIYGLLGPNGSGKSTTIKMLLGLLQPTAGRIAVLGKRPKDVEIKRLIGYLPEESYLYRFLSGRETLEYYGRLFRLERRARRERIDMLLDMVGLEAVQHRPVGEYSKGMQRRIGLAQSLINDPQLLILDEPTSGMDPVGARQIKDLIGTLAARGKTVLLCSHLLSDVEDLCDRVAIMYGGRVRAEGTCDELLQQEQATLLHTSALGEPVLAEIRDVLRRHDLSLTKVERPRRRLESLFLEIVDRARAEGVGTSGASSGGAVADFLAGPQPAATAAGPTEAPVDKQLLESLVKR